VQQLRFGPYNSNPARFRQPLRCQPGLLDGERVCPFWTMFYWGRTSSSTASVWRWSTAQSSERLDSRTTDWLPAYHSIATRQCDFS